MTGTRRRSSVVVVRLHEDGTLDDMFRDGGIGFGQIERGFALSAAVLASPQRLVVSGVAGKSKQDSEAEPSPNRGALAKFRL